MSSSGYGSSKLGGLPDLSYGPVTAQPPPVPNADATVAAWDKLGDQAEAIGNNYLKQQATIKGSQDAAQAKVTKDATGNIQFSDVPSPRFPLTDADAAYNSAVDSGTLAKAQLAARSAIATIQQQNIGNPDGFRAGIDKMSAGILDQLPGQFQPAVRNMIDQESGEALGQLNRQTLTATAENAKNSQLALWQSDADMLSGYARSGQYDPANPTPVQTRLLGEMASIEQHAKGNPALAPSEEELQRFDSFGSSLMADLAMYHSKGDLAQYGEAEAERRFIAKINDPSLRLSDQERQRIQTEGVANIRMQDGMQKADLWEQQQAVEAQMKDLQSEALDTGKYSLPDAAIYTAFKNNPARAGQMINSLHDAVTQWGVGQQMKLTSLQQDHAILARLNPSTPGSSFAPRPVDASLTASRKSAALQYFKSQGWSPAQASALTANLTYESGLNPDQPTKTPGENGWGLGQWHGDRAQQFQKVIGKPLQGSTFEDQLRFVNYELTQGEYKDVGAQLKGTNDLGGATNLILDHYEVPADRNASRAVRQQYAQANMKLADSGQIGSDAPLFSPEMQGGDGAAGGFSGYHAASRSYTAAMSAYVKKQTALKDDPVNYVRQVRPDIDSALSSTDPVTVQKGIDNSLAQQRDLGVGNPQILTKLDQQRWADLFQHPVAGMQSSDNMIRTIATMQQVYGPYAQRAVAQISKGLPPEVTGLAQLVLPSNSPARTDIITAKRMANAAYAGRQALDKAVPNGLSATIDQTVATEMADFNSTVRGFGSSAATATIMQYVQTYARQLVAEGTKPEDAGKQAVQDIIDCRYQYNDGYRVPAGIDLGSIWRGTGVAVDKITPENIEPYGEAARGISIEFHKSLSPGVLRANGSWITMPDDSGLALTWGPSTGYILARDANKHPIKYTWAQLLALSNQSHNVEIPPPPPYLPGQPQAGLR